MSFAFPTVTHGHDNYRIKDIYIMAMFILGLAVGCAGCALVAVVLFAVLGVSIVGRKGKHPDDK